MIEFITDWLHLSGWAFGIMFIMVVILSIIYEIIDYVRFVYKKYDERGNFVVIIFIAISLIIGLIAAIIHRLNYELFCNIMSFFYK